MGSPRLHLSALVLVLAVLAAACGSGDGSSGAASGGSGGSEPFTAAVIGGGELSSASFEGQDTVLWFWAPWCTICRGEAPEIVDAVESFDGDVQLIGVAGRGDVPEMEDFVADTGTGGLTHIVDEDGSIWASFEVVSQPSFAFIDDDGSVEVYTGALGTNGLLERMTALAGA